MEGATHFKDVTLLVTHYNRSRSLERLLQTFADMKCSFEDIVVSDDCSKPEHLEYIKNLHSRFNFRLITTPKNGGLGNNINKGQDAITTPYTLYVQEDFVPLPGSITHLKNGLELLEDRKDFDTVRFYAYSKYPYLRPFKYGFSEMLFSPWYDGLDKFAYYSDHPHLRRSTFFDKFGRYLEGTSGDKTEFTMMMSFLRKKGKSFFFDEHKSVFDQINSSVEPSTMKRNYWRNSNNTFVTFLRHIYRYINCYYNLYF